MKSVNSADELLSIIRPDSERNGAAMRAAPLGYIKCKDRLVSAAINQAKVTHNTDIAIKSSVAVALAAHFGIFLNGIILDLQSNLIDTGYGDWDYSWNKEVSVGAYDSVSAALTCLCECRSFTDLLKMSVDLGGDTDSVASIAAGIAACFKEYDMTIPESLIQGFDEKEFGIQFLNNIDLQLFKMAA